MGSQEERLRLMLAKQPGFVRNKSAEMFIKAKQQPINQPGQPSCSSSKRPNRQHSKERGHGNDKSLSVFKQVESHPSSTHTSSGRPATRGGKQPVQRPRPFVSHSHPASGDNETSEVRVQGNPRGRRGVGQRRHPPQQVQNWLECVPSRDMSERRDPPEHRMRKPKTYGSQPNLLDSFISGSVENETQRQQQKQQRHTEGHRGRHPQKPQHMQNRSKDVTEKNRSERRDQSQHRRRNPNHYGSQPNLLDLAVNETQRQQKPRGRQPFTRGRGRENHHTSRESYSQRPGSQTCDKLGQRKFTHTSRTNQPHQHAQPSAAAASKPVQHKQWRIDSRELECLSVLAPANIITRLASPRSGLTDFLNQANPDKNLIVSFLKVLCLAFKCQSSRHNLHYLLELIKTSMFLKSILPEFVVSAQTEVLPEAHLENSANLASTVKLLCELITVYPASAFLEVSLLAALVQSTSTYLQSIGFPASTETRENLGNLQQMIATLQDKKRDGSLKSDSYNYFTGPEVGDFRSISIYPTYDDIHLINKPYVRPNIVTGKYPDTATYLDIHFRLLREDFVRPLRDGISKLLTCNQKDLKNNKIDDIRIYFDAHILGPLCTRSGVFFQVQFDVKLLKFVRWESSKRLLFGSFLCLSKDNFDTMLFATVANRGIEELKSGIITLSFIEESRHRLVDIKSSDSFLMVETTAYFEAYRHILEGLKNIKDNELPFQKYFVECQTQIAEPKYLKCGYQNYTLEPLMNEKMLKRPMQSNLTMFNLLNISSDFNVRDFGKWPSKEKLKLDVSQMRAIQTAVTKELAIIQGPPGTGKTFLGLKVVKVLLANMDIWQAAGASPILVVCYTNHALDQFLEGIHKFLDTGLVRVGGRSDSKTLSKFSLNTLRREVNFRKVLPGYLKGTHTALIEEREGIQRTIEMLAASLEASENGVLQMYTLAEHVTPKHLKSLQVAFGGRPSRRPGILDWLGITSAIKCYFPSELNTADRRAEEELEEMDSNEMEGDAGSPTDSAEEEGPAEEDAETIEVGLEAELLQAQGLLGDNDCQNVAVHMTTSQEWFCDDNLKGTADHSESQTSSGNEDYWELPSDATEVDQSNLLEESELTSATRCYLESKEQTTEEDREETESIFTEGDAASTSDLTEEDEQTEDDDDELIHVDEEAELLQAERIIGDDNLQKQVKSATARLAAIRQRFLAFHPDDTERPSKSQAESEDNDGDGGWETKTKSKKQMRAMVKKQLKRTDYMPEDNANSIDNVWELELHDRWRLYRLWLLNYQIETRRKMLTHEVQYQKIVNRLAELRNQEEMIVLRKSKVVGMTTTGAAKYRTVLQDIQPKIVIVEEAAEVLEAHIITTLSSACEHLILIGDHQQLRPSATVYELAKDFHLDVSLFERLIKMNVEFVRLDYQHRMRPEIAKLITPHIYENLENVESVKLYENIKGISTNLYFIDHQQPENGTKEGKSFHNAHEALFVKALCNYLIQQEYKPSQITILTTYSGQLLYLRKIMPKNQFDGVQVCVVDKYQGEENDIVILSLVRSNPQGGVGFLRIPNRICVALSRAKKGFYCIGNMKMLSSKVQLWRAIVDWLRSSGRIGTALTLCCQNHPGNEALVSTADDFGQVPAGGCFLPCNMRLECGHACASHCHPADPEHKQYKCLKPCQVLCEQGHKCPDRCCEPCGKCNNKVVKVIPQCGHEQQVPCYLPLGKFICQEPCRKTMECGHQCVRHCGETCTKMCMVKVKIPLSCRHQRKVLCHLQESELANSGTLLCKMPCGAQLSCGHSCKAVCCDCVGGRFHLPCSSLCGRTLICSHTCSECCSTECPPCARACDNHCPHGKCPKQCGEACVPCMKPCEWTCPHFQCTKWCHELCNRKRCNQPCNQMLVCGHPCIGLCGEPCPSKCRVCHEDEVTEIFFGREDEPSTRFIQLEDCRHIFAVSGLDGWMLQSEDSGSVPKLILCPKCETPIRRNGRYGNTIKSTLAKIEKAKAKILGDGEELKSWEKNLEQFLEARTEMFDYYTTEVLDLQLQLREPNTSAHKLAILGHKISLLAKIAELKSKGKKLLEEQRAKIQKETEWQTKWILRSRVQFTPQEISNIEHEISKLTHLNDIYLLQNSMQKQRKLFDLSSQLTLNELLQVLENGKAECEEKWLHESVTRLKKKYPLTGGMC
ncbi:NFX1-type zinc finger-containing protein 1-like [Scyliorhinus canicula]|uniref:NFX1-type zinc finger-containing protein 1-like n=1 Tax=Scyliorhinus canicula TaxID=7830 RepID=UPI0018F59024|nr:NFX1-type zinc finger-containing protein 1-like [Scyliorhinus canicula]